MRKFALLSYHFWYNYGTCLQAYALWRVFKDLGVDAEYLNFGWRYPIPSHVYLENWWRYTMPRIGLLSNVKFFLLRYGRALKHGNLNNVVRSDWVRRSNSRRFDRFKLKYIRESEPVDIEHDVKLLSRYEKFVVGSDQTWNPDCAELKYFEKFLLSFVQDPEKKACYAPSVGRTVVDDATRSVFKRFLSSFAYLSCRERSGCRILKEVLGREVEHVLDPTLLLLPDEWRKIGAKINCNTPFVLCYILGRKKSIVKYALQLAERSCAELKLITVDAELISEYGKYLVAGIGPSEFIALVDNALAVVTDSFHGTAFAINFNKDFYSFLKRGRSVSASDNGRIGELLKVFDLEDRMCDDISDIKHKSIDFNYVNLLLEKERTLSVEYLKRLIGDV